MKIRPWIMMACIAVIMQVVTGCSRCSRSSDEGFANLPDSLSRTTAIPVKLIEDVVENLASPIETASLIKSLNVPFSQKYLSQTSHLQNYNTAHSKAFNLGVFGADLGYLNIYGRNTLIMDYVVAMKSLADDLKIGQFFNYRTLKRLADNHENIDSIVYISQQSFNKMDRYLRRSGRGNLSAVMICGVWVEAMYLSGQFYRESHSARLAEAIGEQEQILKELLRMLEHFKNQEEAVGLAIELRTLYELFGDIKITVKEGELKQVEEDGKLTIVQGETTEVHYTEAQITAIIARVEEIRNRFIL